MESAISSNSTSSSTTATAAINKNKNNKISIKDVVPVLLQSHCKIKNFDYVENIINELINGGPNKLQVISDFDYTITKQKLNNNEPVLSSFCIFELCKSLPKEYINKSHQLSKKYRPIEIDPKIPTDEKVKYMIEWWTQSSNLLKGFPFDENEIDEVSYPYRNALRDGTQILFNKLNKLNVPLLIFSAGLGNSVQSVLKHANLILPNVKIISNFLKFNNGIVDGFKNEQIIHVFNKNESALKGTEYYNLVHNRDHVIVMGDSIGDANMANGVPNSSYILKIGFLFHHVEENLEHYMNTFDIVLINDQTMDVPNALISLIENGGTNNL